MYNNNLNMNSKVVTSKESVMLSIMQHNLALTASNCLERSINLPKYYPIKTHSYDHGILGVTIFNSINIVGISFFLKKYEYYN